MPVREICSGSDYKLPPEFINRIDPWSIPPKRPPFSEPDPIPWIDLEPILDSAVGGAIVGIREEFQKFGEQVRERANDETLDAAIERGAETGLRLAARSLGESNKLAAGIAQMLTVEKPRGEKQPKGKPGKR